MVTRWNSRAHRSDDDHDFFNVPWEYIDSHPADFNDTEQHRELRGQRLRKHSIRHYRHATTKWGAALESFSPMWFAITISTGGLASILNGPFPYPAAWQDTLASILYVFEIVLFVLFSAIMIARWIMYPHVAIRRALSSPDELGAYAILPIAVLTIAALTASQVSETQWGGHAFTLVAYVLWWIGLIWIFVTAIVVLTTFFYTGNQMDRVMTPVLFMAPVGLATAGVEAGFITIFGTEMSSRLAVPMVIVGYHAVGVAFFMAVILYTIYFHRLLAAGWSSPATRGGLFILIGPAGQLSTAFQLLGESASANMRFAQYKPQSVKPPTFGTFWRQQTASGIDGAGLLLTLMLQGFDYLCLCIAVVGVIDVFVKRQPTYTLTWWSVVFPSVTLCTSWLELGSAMDSPTFRTLSTAFFLIIFICYLLNWAFTIRGVANGSLVWADSELQRERAILKKVQQAEKKSDETV